MANRRNWVLAGASVIVLAGLASGVRAAEAETAAADPKGQIATVEEIVVTAQKREQTLQRVPLTVTAVTSQTLQQAGVVDMQGIANLVPALSTVETNGSGNQSYKIRGIGSDPNTPTFEPDVALFIDGVYLPRSGMSVDDLTDIARVEVLEGPQSTLYGKNATGGVINIVTKAPAHKFEAQIEGSYSMLQSSLNAPVERVSGSLSGPINDHLRARVSFVTYNQADSYKNLEPGAGNANNMNRYALRGEIEADLGPSTTLRIAAMRSEVYHTRSTDPDVMYYSSAPANNAYKLDFGPLGSLFHITPCPDNNPSDRVICTSKPMELSTFSNVLSSTLTTKLGRNTLTSITALSDYGNHLHWTDAAEVILPVVDYTDVQKGGTFSQEIRLTSPNGEKIEWLAGLYYQHVGFARGNDGKSPTFVLGPAAAYIPLPHSPALPPQFVLGEPGDEGILNSKSRSGYFAGFGQATWRASDKVSLTAGARVQTEEKHASVDNSYVVSPATPVIPIGPCGTFPLNLITANLTPVNLPGCPQTPVNAAFAHATTSATWNATAEYHLDPNSMLYATVSRGGKSFGYNIGFGNSTAAQRPFKDEFVTSYELGLKTSLFNGRARLSADAFHADYHNFQNAGFVGLQFLVDNAQHVELNGFEANGVFAFGQGFTGNAGVTYVDAKYDRYTQGSPYYGNPRTDLSGDSLPLVPHWRTNVGLQYKRTLSFGGFYSRLDWTWQSSELTNTNLDPRSLQPAYSLINARIGVKTDNGFDVSLWSNNLFNTTYIQQDAVSTLFGANDPEFQRYLGRPREFGVTVRKSF